MNDKWKDIIVTQIKLAMYVEPGTGTVIHNNRPLHGLVLNDDDAIKEYTFSDGYVMHTEGSDLFYLPKGSTYKAKSLVRSGCYAINFDADFADEPFIVKFRNAEPLLKSFKEAAKVWRRQSEFKNASVMKYLYDIILQLCEETSEKYIPESNMRIIMPAIDKIHADFTANDINVDELAKLCGISEVYFRRLFLNKFGTTPKEYIIMMRISYAKQLLESKQFTVSQTAALCGYTEPCHFSREFHKHVGVSPSEYRKRYI